MGIIAHCPAGHRVKVKEHLAGRKGICPECGARFRIPEAPASPAWSPGPLPAGLGDDPPSPRTPAAARPVDVEEPRGPAVGFTAAETFAPKAAEVVPAAEIAPASGVPASAAPAEELPVIDAPGLGAPVVDAPAAGVTAAAPRFPTADFVSFDELLAASLPSVVPFEEAPATAGDGAGWPPALAEAPMLLWCIAEPGGEPSAPLTAAAMHDWLRSGQVRGSEVVWRSDWTEWVGVGTAFPEHVPPAGPGSPAP